MNKDFFIELWELWDLYSHTELNDSDCEQFISEITEIDKKYHTLYHRHFLTALFFALDDLEKVIDQSGVKV